MPTDHMTQMYVRDLTRAKNSADLSWNLASAVEAIGHATDLVPDMAFSVWALATAAKARRLELAELHPEASITRTLVRMGAVSTVSSVILLGMTA